MAYKGKGKDKRHPYIAKFECQSITLNLAEYQTSSGNYANKDGTQKHSEISSAPQARTGRAPKNHGRYDAPSCRSITHTSGTVLRPLILSPVWSYMSCECTVVKMIAAKTANYRTNFVSSGKGIPRATSIAPEVKHTQPYAFLTTQLLSPLAKSLYQTLKTTKLSDCLMPSVSMLSATATGYRASTSFSAC